MSAVMDIVESGFIWGTGHAWYEHNNAGEELKVRQHIYNEKALDRTVALCGRSLVDGYGCDIRSAWPIDEPAPFEYDDTYKMVWCKACAQASETEQRARRARRAAARAAAQR